MTTVIPYRPLIACLAIATALAGFTSCAKLNITKYYHRHHPTLDSIEATFREAYSQKPFSIEFTDRSFDRVSIELITDTLTYIYEYHVGETRIQDTLHKYGYDSIPIDMLITSMRDLNCTWIDKLDYYSEEQRHSLVYLSLWPRAINSPFVNKKYYILAYFQQPQFFDSQGRLLTGRRRRHIRKINAAVYLRLTDRTAYTISDRFR